MPPLSVMLKPSSSLCNMSCAYCFYHSLAEQRESFSYGMMSKETVQTVIKKALSYASGAPLYLSFQGGEPLLSGKEFFRFVSETVSKENTYHSSVTLAVQTNGLLIDNEWCNIFKEGDWLVGLSLDGDEISNCNRMDHDGNPVFSRVLSAAKLLQSSQVSFNILSVITEESAKNIKNVYRFLTEEGFLHLQLIPCLKPLGTTASPLTMTAKTYGDYLITLFKLYLADIRRGNYVSIRQMDNFVRLAKGHHPEQCGMNGVCGMNFIVEGDGTVFPCDFYCLDGYRLGNIKESGFDALSAHPKMKEFIKESTVVSYKCKTCPYFTMCRGGCKRERLDLEKCEGYKRFFSYALPYLVKIS